MRLKYSLIVATITLVGLTASANASPIAVDYNPDGANNSYSLSIFSGPPIPQTDPLQQIDLLDWIAGTGISRQITPGSPSTVGTQYDFYFQGLLGATKLGGSTNTPFGLNGNFPPPGIVSYSGGFETTLVLGFREMVTSVSGPNSTFDLTGGGPNFFEIYYDSSLDANSGGFGAGYTSFSDGTKILSGFLTSAVTDFNNSNGNGSVQAVGTITQRNAAFFPTLNIGNTIAFTQGSVLLPPVNPPYATYNGAPNGATSITTGAGDIPFAVDIATEFDKASVPEPTTCALMAVGSAGLVLMVGQPVRRNRKTA